MPLIRVSSGDVEELGLLLVGFGGRTKVSERLRTERFKHHFAVSPAAYKGLFEDLQQWSTLKFVELDKLLWCGYWLKTNSGRSLMAGSTRVHENTIAGWCWTYAKAIQQLVERKLNFDEKINQSDKIIVLSVDGVHFRSREIRKDPSSKWYSFKHNGPGLTYELGIAIWEDSNALAWINGPFKSSKNDIGIFTSEGGLEDSLVVGKKALGDHGYDGARKNGKLTTKSHLDGKDVAQWKNLALARHENFNERIKEFGVLAAAFKYDISKHRLVMDAVCVLTMYDLENGRPLNDI